MTYTELKNKVVSDPHLRTRWDVASWLIGFQKVVTESDWDNIMILFLNNYID